MRLKIFVLVSVGLLAYLSLSSQMIQHTFRDGVDTNVLFTRNTQIIVDSVGHLTIGQLLSDSTIQGVDLKAENMPNPPYYLWASIRLTNAGRTLRNEHLLSMMDIDSIWCYVIHEGQVVHQYLSGGGVSPWEKTPAHTRNIIPITLGPGETQTLLLRFKVVLPVTRHYLHKLAKFYPAQRINHEIITTYTWHFFYLGFMLLFSVLSVLMHLVFKDRVFLYFGVLMISFGGYSLSINGVWDIFFWEYFPTSQFIFLNTLITGIVISMTLIAVNYLQLREYMPRYVRWLWVYTLVMQLFLHVGQMVLPHNQIVPPHNILMLGWVVGIVGPAWWLARRGQRAARIFVATIFILFLGAILQIIDGMNPNRQGFTYIYAFQVGTLVFSIILFYDLFRRIDTIRRDKERFEELNGLKSRFFANISHEFRTPLTLIMGPLQQLAHKLPAPDDRRMIKLMQRNAERLLHLINQILDLSKLEAGKLELMAQRVNFPALLKGIVMSFESLAEQKGVRLHYGSQEDELELWVDPGKVEQIFNNLLSNAFKFTSVSDEVSVLLTTDENWVAIQVKDTGQGIPADKLPHIFNRFFQADTTVAESQGTGIGLTLVKELVHLHGGHISVKSVEGKYTSFKVKLPRGRKHLHASQVLETPQPWMASPVTPVVEEELWPTRRGQAGAMDPTDLHNAEAPLVLVIEDHADVRFYIVQNLRNHYRIMEAMDGQDGIDKAWEYLPDLVISDVMMPVKNGYEVCKALKNDQRSSHIPLILLTAKAAREEKLLGLEEGADDYLLKPFDTAELQLRVRNLIDSRRQLRQQFQSAAEQSGLDPQLSAPDQAFLTAVYAAIDAHLDDEQFGVDDLADLVGMSRRHLNRKLSALTDLSANPFIRNYRLQKAWRMLENREGNVSEVALATGFSSTAYFVKCFREKFGQTPGTV